MQGTEGGVVVQGAKCKRGQLVKLPRQAGTGGPKHIPP